MGSKPILNIFRPCKNLNDGSVPNTNNPKENEQITRSNSLKIIGFKNRTVQIRSAEEKIQAIGPNYNSNIRYLLAQNIMVSTGFI